MTRIIQRLRAEDLFFFFLKSPKNLKKSAASRNETFFFMEINLESGLASRNEDLFW